MTDITLPTSTPIDVTSDAARRRVARRYAAERRFRIYGMAAVLFAAAFLIILVADIVWKALPALTVSSLRQPVTLTAAAIDPSGGKDPAAIARGDFLKVAREALMARFPGAASKRAMRKSVHAVLSSEAAAGLRRDTMSNPGLIGQTVDTRLLLSDSAGFYLAGLATGTTSLAGQGSASPSAVEGKVTITADQPAFSSLASQSAPKPTVIVLINGGAVHATSVAADKIEGEAILPLSSTSPAATGAWRTLVLDTPEGNRKINDVQIAVLETLKAEGLIDRGFNWGFLTASDSREAELAGILGALVGSALTMLVTLAICLPAGVLAAIYLEEFAPKNQLTDLIEVSINNLAAVPSIVFGLLGLAVFLNFFGLPRSSPLVGGLVLALLVLPTIIIASRAALNAVPPSIREAALGVGASKMQAVFDHVLPLAMPGILTGTILGTARALGETAPLLMIGMIAFIVDVPASVSDAATVLPVQIFLWSDLPEAGFQAKTAAAILVLLVFLFVMNGAAILLRRRFERRW